MEEKIQKMALEILKQLIATNGINMCSTYPKLAVNLAEQIILESARQHSQLKKDLSLLKDY